MVAGSRPGRFRSSGGGSIIIITTTGSPPGPLRRLDTPA
jgi:hypothetical protein